jgi:hypothetical protein
MEEVRTLQYQRQEILVETRDGYGDRPPMEFCGTIFRGLTPMLGYSVRMAIEGASSSAGAPPVWLRRASDVRVTGVSGREAATIFHVEAPPLGEAAKEVYLQDSLWETKPAETDTAINVAARVFDDVARADAESSRYDRQLLSRIMRMRRVFDDRVVSIRFPVAMTNGGLSTLVTPQVVQSAARLADRTPQPRQVRLTGVLDMIRHSTRSFGLKLEDGGEVRGVLETHEQMEDLKQFLGKKLLVLGRAVYRPSGKLLRVDAEGFEAGEGQPLLFAKVPPARETRPALVRMKPVSHQRQGVPAFFGTWPGEETDEDFERILVELRG